MLPSTLWVLCLTAIGAQARTTTTSADLFSRTFSTIPYTSTADFTGSQYTYVSYSAQSTVSSSSSNESSSETLLTRSTSTGSVTQIGGTPSNSTASSTSSASESVNTVPCNNYAEFCNRKYSNITEVCAHNSAFAIQGNAASNQYYGITDQLNDGIRMCRWILFSQCL
jgi:hypothetical protein